MSAPSETINAAALLEQERDRILPACRELGDDQGFEQVAVAVFDDLLAALRGIEPPSHDTYRVHPDDSLRLTIGLFRVLSAPLITALTASGASPDQISVVVTGLHTDLMDKSGAAAFRYIEYLKERVVTADQDERSRIVRELEGRVVPRIWAAFAEFSRYQRGEGPERLESAVDGLVGTLGTIREVNTALRRRHSGGSLETALRDHMASEGGEMRLVVAGDENLLSGEAREQLVLALSEIVRAVLRHGRTSLVDLNVRIVSREIRCVVGASGAWVTATSATPLGRALVSLRERVELLRGEMVREVRPVGGSQVRLTVPVSNVTKGTSAT